MRHVLTGLALLLVLAILAAMTVPHFIDFSQYRRFFEERITAMTGLPTTISGVIKVRLLPTPTLSLRQVQIGPKDERGFPLFEAERIAGTVAAMPLLRGDIHIAEAIVDRPVVRVGEQGLPALDGVRLPSGGENGGAVVLEKLLIADGMVTIQRKGRESLTFSEYNGEIEAGSLQGPARGNGHFVMDGRKRFIRFSVGKIENNRTRAKALLEDELLALRLDVDGVVALSADPAERFDGTLSLVSNSALGTQERVQLPLRISAKAKLAGQDLTLDDIAVVVGQDGQPLTLSGLGKVRLESRAKYDVTLSTRSYDFDRPGPDGRPRRVVPSELIRELAALFPQGAGAPDVEGRLDLSAGALIISGQTVVGPRLIVNHSTTGIQVVKAEAELPGQTRVLFERDALSDSGILSGLLQIDSRDPERLNGWFNGVARTTTAAAATRANAVLSAIKDGVQIDRVEIDRGDTHLSGTGRYLLSTPAARPAPQLSLKLATQRLHVNDIPAFIPGSDRREEKPDLDFDLDLAADSLMLEGRDIGRLVTKVRRDGAITSIERVEIAGLENSSFIASGTLGGGARRVTFKLDAQRADGIAAVAEQVFPGPVTQGLRRRAEALSPALVVATLANNEVDDTFDLAAEGELGGSKIVANGKLVAKADIQIDLSLRLDNPDSGRLARQLSGTQRALTANLPGSGHLSIKGNPRATMEIVAEAKLFGIDADVRGGVNLFQPFVPFNGIIAARAGDLFPAMGALGIDPAYLERGVRGSLTGKVESNLQKITIADMRMQMGETPLAGEIAFKLSEGGAVAGQIKLPSIDLRPILATVVGPMPHFLPQGQWSTAAFPRPLPIPVQGDLWIEAEKAQLDNVTLLDGARFVLRFQNDALAVEHGAFKRGTLRITGDASLRRTGTLLSTTARFNFADLNLASAFSPTLKGIAEGEMQAAANGESPAKLVQSLAGSGQARVKELIVAGHDPAALARLIAVPPPQIGAIDSANLTRRLDGELQKGPLNAGDARFALVVIDGVLRVGNASQTSGGLQNDISGTFDLAKLTGDFRIQSTMTSSPENWQGAQPAFIAQWRGVPGAMQRSLSVDQIVNGYLAAALQRDAELRDIQEQDLRERAYFNRRLKAMEWEKRRNEEARQDALRAEQARLAEEERLRRQKAAEDAAARREAERQQRLPPPATEAPATTTGPLNLRPPGQ